MNVTHVRSKCPDTTRAVYGAVKSVRESTTGLPNCGSTQVEFTHELSSELGGGLYSLELEPVDRSA